MRKLVAFFATLLLAFSFSYSAVSAESDEQWIEPSTTQDGHFSVVFKDSVNVFNQFPMLQAYKNINGVQNNFVCADVNTSDCANADSYFYTALLPVCADSTQVDCIESLSAISENGTIETGKFSKYIYSKHPNAFAANETLKIPKTESPGIWSFSSAKHSYGNEYALATGFSSLASYQFPQRSSNLFAYLYPVSVHTGIGDQGRNIDGFSNIPECLKRILPATGVNTVGCTAGGVDGLGKYNCPLQLDVNRDCLLQHEFPTGFKFQISIRLAEQPSGWLYGRLLDPSIAISDLPGGGARVVVTAAPTKVPALYAGDNWVNLPSSIQDYYLPCIKAQTCHVMSRQPRIEGPYTDPLLLNAQRWPEATESGSFDELKIWTALSKDTASALPSAWNFKMSPVGVLNNSNACFRNGNGLKGIVTTNATLYSEAPPVLVDSKLQYKVAAPHFNKDGSEFKGTYNLVIRSDVARCIYGFTTAPIQASIDVVTENGVESIATTAIAEKDGWLSLSAYNFGFSAPTIKATLKQEVAAPTPTPTPTVTATPSASATPSATAMPSATATPTPSATPIVKKITITCVKGKSVKKVTAVKPACPKGYKKK